VSHLQLNADDVARLLVKEGATGWAVVTMGAIAAAESGRDAYNLSVVHAPGKAWHRSVDQGLYQVSSFWFPAHRQIDLVDPVYCTRVALDILDDAGGPGDGYTRWNVYESGAYKPFVSECRAAARRAGVDV